MGYNEERLSGYKSGSESAGEHPLSRKYPRNGVVLTESAIDLEDVAKDRHWFSHTFVVVAVSEEKQQQ